MSKEKPLSKRVDEMSLSKLDMSAFVNDNYRGVFLVLPIFVAARNDSLEM